jgi:hypothetical protein
VMGFALYNVANIFVIIVLYDFYCFSCGCHHLNTFW